MSQQYVTRYDGNFYISNCPCAGQGLGSECRCGEEQKDLDWIWDPYTATSDTNLVDQGKEAVFHPSYSSGTAAVRGTQLLNTGQHYWEIKMTTPVYGTDMMIGIGTKDAKLDEVKNKFTSLLGIDAESWGLSYQGNIHHSGLWERYARHRVGQGTVVGVHLDNWHGTLSYYLNGEPQGAAFDELRGKNLYPMISSTAARSGMKLVATRFFPTSLQFLCCQKLRMSVRPNKHVLDVLPFPPGLATMLRQRLNWLLRPSGIPHPEHCLARPSLSHLIPRSCHCQRVSCNNCLSRLPPYLPFSPASSAISPYCSQLHHHGSFDWDRYKGPVVLGEIPPVSSLSSPLIDEDDGSRDGSSTPDLLGSETGVDYDPAIEYLDIHLASSSASTSASALGQASTSRGQFDEDLTQMRGGGDESMVRVTRRGKAKVQHDEHRLHPETSWQRSSSSGSGRKKGKKRKACASDSEDDRQIEKWIREGEDSEEDRDLRRTTAAKSKKKRAKKQRR